MRKLLHVLFCFLTIPVSFGQAGGVQDSSASAKSYLDYYHAIAFAEEAVVTGNYRDAIRQYHDIFEAYPYNNPIDCYIAAQVAAYISDTASCIHSLYKGLRFGLPVQTIAGNPHLAGIFKTMDQGAIDSCQNLYAQSIDHEAWAAMIALIKRDQSTIHSLPPGEDLYDPGGYVLKDKYRPVWDSLLKALIILTRSSGFPAHKIIGTQNGDDSLFRVSPNSVFAIPIFIHHSNAWSQVGDLLWAELLKGNITPQMYGVIYEHSSGHDSYKTSVLYFAARYCQEKKCRKLVKRQLAEINAARWRIGLGSYEVMQQKFESMSRYYKWKRNVVKSSEPVFDFECDLGFQGKE